MITIKGLTKQYGKALVGLTRTGSPLSTNRTHRTVDSSHTGLLEDAEPATASVRAITDGHPRGPQQHAPSGLLRRSDVRHHQS